jgi:hypothetical protein
LTASTRHVFIAGAVPVADRPRVLFSEGAAMNRIVFVRSLAALGLLALILAGGCASGQKFDTSKISYLLIGQLHDTDYQALFGEPTTVTRDSGNDGAFETVTYNYGHSDLSDARARQLVLEFRNGVLNGYNYVSSFDDDKTNANTAAAAQIVRVSSNKTDVLRLLGQPSGKARTPTEMEGFVKVSKPGVYEIWCWESLDAVPILGSQKTGSNVIVVGFDPMGMVSEVMIQQENIASTQPAATPSATPTRVPGN